MSWECIASRSQLHMISTLHYYSVACIYTAQDLYFLAIACSKLHFLLLVAFLALLDVDEIQALFLGQRFYWDRNYVFHWLREEVNFNERTRDDVTLVVETESYRYVERTATSRLAIRENLTVQGV